MGWFSKSSSVSQTAGSSNQQPQTTLSDKVEMLRAQFGLDKELKSHEVVSIAVERLELSNIRGMGLMMQADECLAALSNKGPSPPGAPRMVWDETEDAVLEQLLQSTRTDAPAGASASSSSHAPPALMRTKSAKLEKIAQIRAVAGDGHSDNALRVLLAKHGDDCEAVINELFEEMINEVQASFGASSRNVSRQGSGHLNLAAAGSSSMEVTCPDGVRAGETVTFPTPSGAWMEVQVPAGVRAGDVFTVEVGGAPSAPIDAAPAMWVCAQCTLENRLEEASCAACDAPRSGHQTAAAHGGRRRPSNAARPSVGAPPAAPPPVARASSNPRLVVPPREPETLEEFVASAVGGSVQLRMQLLLPSGKTIEVERAMPAAQVRSQLGWVVSPEVRGSHGGVVHDNNPSLPLPPEQLPPEQPPPRPEPTASSARRSRTPPPRAPAPSAAVGAAGDIRGGRAHFSTPSANQGAFGGERVGLPAHRTRQPSKPRGPPQRAISERLTLEEVQGQLGDAALQRAIDEAAAAGGAAAINAPVNPDIGADSALYDDGVGGQFERSAYIDPHRDKRGQGAAPTPLAARKVEVEGPPPLGADGTQQLPVAYEVAAVGARIQNMARVGGQRVLEMDHFVESTATPIVRLTLPGEANQAEAGKDKRSALLQARKVLERKLLQSRANAPAIDLFPGAANGPPPLRVLTTLGDAGSGAPVAPPPAHVKLYGQLMWDVLVEVVEKILGRKHRDVIGGLYYMPTVRADVFVCSPMDASSLLHINVLVFQQSLSCECDDDDVTRPLRIAPDKWRQLLPYWLCRITSALNESKAGTTVGMYDDSIRKRLIERVRARGGAQAVGAHAGCVGPLVAKPQKWTPPPLPTEVLTNG